jgi:hypothetical protein
LRNKWRRQHHGRDAEISKESREAVNAIKGKWAPGENMTKDDYEKQNEFDG